MRYLFLVFQQGQYFFGSSVLALFSSLLFYFSSSLFSLHTLQLASEVCQGRVGQDRWLVCGLRGAASTRLLAQLRVGTDLGAAVLARHVHGAASNGGEPQAVQDHLHLLLREARKGAN